MVNSYSQLFWWGQVSKNGGGGGKGAGRTELSLFFRGGDGHKPKEKLPALERHVGKAVLESLVNLLSVTWERVSEDWEGQKDESKNKLRKYDTTGECWERAVTSRKLWHPLLTGKTSQLGSRQSPSVLGSKQAIRLGQRGPGIWSRGKEVLPGPQHLHCRTSVFFPVHPTHILWPALPSVT